MAHLHYHVFWNDETIDNEGNCKQETYDKHAVCVRRKLIARYSGMVEKVELSMKFDVSSFPGCILDENKPVIINGQRVPLQLPSDRNRLKYVELSGVDITKYFKASAAGELNTIDLHYRVRNRPSIFGIGKKNVGKLKLELAVYSAGEGGETYQKQPPPSEKKFCMWHGEPVDIAALFCPYKGGEGFETTITPKTSKRCPNPGCPHRTIHIREIYCEYCGVKQPGM